MTNEVLFRPPFRRPFATRGRKVLRETSLVYTPISATLRNVVPIPSVSFLVV